MATPVDGSKIFISFMPTLLDMALVKVALSLYEGVDRKMLNMVFKNIQHQNSAVSNEGSQENHERYMTKKKHILLIPVRLRKRLLETVNALDHGVSSWSDHHPSILPELNDGKYILYWRSDGTVDRNKTAQQLVMNENINIRKRFKIACKYCLEKSIQTLWSELRVTRKTANFKRHHSLMDSFWIARMRDGSQVHWTQAVLEYFRSQELPFREVGRLSSLFPLLPWEVRQKCLDFLPYVTNDDLRFCLYAMTQEEVEQIVARNADKILILYLEWPLQGYFLEIAEKMWNFINIECFRGILEIIFLLIDCYEDFDYRGIFEGFWNRSPNHLREDVKKGPVWSKKRFGIGKINLIEKIDSYLNEKTRKRKFDNNEQPALKKRLV